MDETYMTRKQQQPVYNEDGLLEETKAKTKDLLTCSLCRQTYRDARSLPCGDAFCMLCLQRYVYGLQDAHQSLKLGSFTCPKCSARIGLPSTGVSAFPKDNRVDQIRERAVEEMTRKLAREHAARTGQNHGGIVESDSSDYIDVDISDSHADVYDLYGRSRDVVNFNRPSSSRLGRTRLGYSTVRETRSAGLRYSKSFTAGSRPGEAAACSESDLHTRMPHREASSYASDLDEMREFVSPIIGRNRTGYSSLRDRRRRTEVDESQSVFNSKIFESKTSTRESGRPTSAYDSYSKNFTNVEQSSETSLLRNRDNKENSKSSVPDLGSERLNRKDNLKSENRKRVSLIDSICADPAADQDDKKLENHLSRFRGVVRAGSLREPSTRSYMDIVRNAELRDDPGSSAHSDEFRRAETSSQSGFSRRQQQDSCGNPNIAKSVTTNHHRSNDINVTLHKHSASTQKQNDVNISNEFSTDTLRLRTPPEVLQSEQLQNNGTTDAHEEINFIRASALRKGTHRKRAPLTDELYKPDDISPSPNSRPTVTGQKPDTVKIIKLPGERNKSEIMKDSTDAKSILTGCEINSSQFGMITDQSKIISDPCTTASDLSTTGSGMISEKTSDPLVDGGTSIDEVINDMFDDFLQEHESEITESATDPDSAMIDTTEGSDTLSGVSEAQLDESGIIDYTPTSPNSNDDSDTIDLAQNLSEVTEVNNVHVNLTTTRDKNEASDGYRSSPIFTLPGHKVENNEIDHQGSYTDITKESRCQSNQNDNHKSEATHQSREKNQSADDKSHNTNASGESNGNSNHGETFEPFFRNNTTNFRRSRVDAGTPENTGSATLEEIRGGDCVTPTAVVSMENASVVADYGGTKLQFLFEDGSPSHSITTLKPFSLAVTAQGDKVFVGDRRHRTIAVFDGYGSDVAQWDTNIFPWISGIGLFRNGNLAVLDRSKCSIGIYSAGGELLKEFGSYGAADTQMCMAEFIAVDSNDRIILSDSGNHCVKVFSVTGQLLTVCGRGRGTSDDGQLQWPKGVCVDGNDNIIVADCCNNRVSMLSSDGCFVEHLVTNIRYPYNVSYSKHRNQIFVTLQSMSRANSYHVYTLPSST